MLKDFSEEILEKVVCILSHKTKCGSSNNCSVAGIMRPLILNPQKSMLSNQLMMLQKIIYILCCP